MCWKFTVQKKVIGEFGEVTVPWPLGSFMCLKFTLYKYKYIFAYSNLQILERRKCLVCGIERGIKRNQARDLS